MRCCGLQGVTVLRNKEGSLDSFPFPNGLLVTPVEELNFY